MATKTHNLPIVDHIVILVSYQTLQEIPQRLENFLTVIEGGAHADGLTVNKLIILPDGTYIELIAFRENVDPHRRNQHQWGSLKEGQISDWAYTFADEKYFVQVQARVKEAASASGITYQDPIPGGRLRPDGVELKWAVSFAQDASLSRLWPGTAPFWCLDRTPRHLRVPYRDEKTGAAPPHTRHPSGAQGVSRLSISVPEKDFSVTSRIYEGVHGPAVEDGPTGKAWPYVNHAGLDQGKRRVVLTTTSGQERQISLALIGTQDSPREVELLPGLTFTFDIE